MYNYRKLEKSLNSDQSSMIYDASAIRHAVEDLKHDLVFLDAMSESLTLTILDRRLDHNDIGDFIDELNNFHREIKQKTRELEQAMSDLNKTLYNRYFKLWEKWNSQDY